MYRTSLDIFSKLLTEHLPAWANRESACFNQEAGDFCDRIVIYGFGSIGRKVLEGLRRLGIEPLGIVDAKLAASADAIEGLPCVSPDEGATRWGKRAVFVVSVFNQTGARAFTFIREELHGRGVERISYFLPLFWKYPATFLPYYSLDLPSKIVRATEEVRRAFALLADDRSRDDFVAFIEAIACPAPTRTLAAVVPEQTYFPRDIVHHSDRETFVDCGAFDGDTLVKFHALTRGQYAAYVGVEPDPANCLKLQARMDSLQSSTNGVMEAKAVAVGRRSHAVAFDSQGSISSAIQQNGGVSIQVETLEMIVGRRSPTFIKMDIQGFEMEALQGGEALLRRTLPRLAICIYHVQDHLWTVPLFIHSFAPSHRFHLRRHSEYLDDVVCYAIPN